MSVMGKCPTGHYRLTEILEVKCHFEGINLVYLTLSNVINT